MKSWWNAVAGVGDATLERLGVAADLGEQRLQHGVGQSEAEVGVEVVEAELPLGRRLLEAGWDRVAVGIVAHGRSGQLERRCEHLRVDEALQLDPSVFVEVVDLVGGHGPTGTRLHVAAPAGAGVTGAGVTGAAHAKIPGPLRKAYSPTASSSGGVYGVATSDTVGPIRPATSASARRSRP